MAPPSVSGVSIIPTILELPLTELLVYCLTPCSLTFIQPIFTHSLAWLISSLLHLILCEGLSRHASSSLSWPVIVLTSHYCCTWIPSLPLMFSLSRIPSIVPFSAIPSILIFKTVYIIQLVLISLEVLYFGTHAGALNFSSHSLGSTSPCCFHLQKLGFFDHSLSWSSVYSEWSQSPALADLHCLPFGILPPSSV